MNIQEKNECKRNWVLKGGLHLVNFLVLKIMCTQMLWIKISLSHPI